MYSEKQRKIDAALYDAVLYLLILHTNGASQYDAVESLARNADHLGAAAKEFCRVIADMDCGYSFSQAFVRLSHTTPSKSLSHFLTGYLSAVQTTGSAVSYLQATLSSLQEERRIRQKRYLDSLSVFAEIFLVLFVAGPLFVVIAAMVLGMISGVDPQIVAVCMFVVFPLGSVAFLLLLESLDSSTKIPYRDIVIPGENHSYHASGTDAALFHALRMFRRKQRIFASLRHPSRFFSEHPAKIFAITVPAAILSAALSTTPIGDTLSRLSPSPYFLEAALLFLILVSPFSFFITQKEKRRHTAESAMPDCLRKLFDLTSRGVSFSDAVCRIAESDNSPIKDDLYRLFCDIQLGDNVSTAFVRFSAAMKIPAITRIVVSLKETLRFAADIPAALHHLAADAKTNLMMTHERESAMSLYVVVIYLGFFVFLFVMSIMLTVFLNAMALPADISVPGISAFPVQVYEKICLWSVLVHAVCSGISAGKMGSGSILSGVKHACVFVAIGTAVMIGVGMI